MLKSNIIKMSLTNMNLPSSNTISIITEQETLGDRIKSYERLATNNIAKKELPLVVRLDGKNFSKYTRQLNIDAKPFSIGFGKIMRSTARYMFEEFNAEVVFTVSDEITLIFINDEKSQHPFGGKLFKIHSLMAAAASTYFTSQINSFIPEKAGTLPIFDCRAFSVPNIMEAYHSILWRHRDGFKNAVSTVARCSFSDKELFKKTTGEKLEMLKGKGIDFETKYDNMFKYGTCLVKKKLRITFTEEELLSLPEKHNARVLGKGEYWRNVISEVVMDELREYLMLTYSNTTLLTQDKEIGNYKDTTVNAH